MQSDVRLYALLARESPRAIIFRRGPSKRVLLISWDMDRDRFEEGQWFNGRIYERRCDLSPDGELLVYFAASYREPFSSWTAVSRPPFLTALALWPKGDAWGGGGHFEERGVLALNHRENEMTLADEFSLPRWMKVKPFCGKGSGRGEDDPIWALRLERDGWIRVSGGAITRRGDANRWLTFDPPIIWEKRHPIEPERTTLRMSITGLKEENGPWYVTEHALISDDGMVEQLPKTGWADWSHSGDLLFARGASLFRLAAFARLAEAREIADFSPCTFVPRAAPEPARKWPRK